MIKWARYWWLKKNHIENLNVEWNMFTFMEGLNINSTVCVMEKHSVLMTPQANTPILASVSEYSQCCPINIQDSPLF